MKILAIDLGKVNCVRVCWTRKVTRLNLIRLRRTDGNLKKYYILLNPTW